MAPSITDLHGNTYTLGKFKLHLEFPKFKDITQHIYTRDLVSKKPFALIKCKRRYWAIFYAQHLYYICYQIKFKSYNPKKDIRNGYKY